MRRVLFLAYLFPPIANSGTRRSLSFANRLPDHGWEPLVLTVDPDPRAPVDRELMDEVRAGTRIVRAPLLSRARAQAWTRWLPSRWRERAAAGIAWRLQMRATVPDDVAGWLKPAVERALQLHGETGFDAIYASGWPWTAFMVAHEVSRRTGKPYVLDYRDCWISGGEHAWEQVSSEQRERAPQLQRQAARDAAALITTTATFAQTIQGQLDGGARFEVIPNGYEESDFHALPARAPDGELHIAYTGVWRPGYGLQDLYGAIARLRDAGHPLLAKLKVDAAGFKPGAAAEFGVAPWVTEHGPVPHRRAVELMTAADLLYLPLPDGFQGRAALAGKHFEYLGSGRPIVASAWPDSETARLADLVGGVHRVDPGDIATLADTLVRSLEAVNAGKAPNLFPPVQREALSGYTRAETARRLAAVLTAAVEGRRLASAPQKPS